MDNLVSELLKELNCNIKIDNEILVSVAHSFSGYCLNDVQRWNVSDEFLNKCFLLCEEILDIENCSIALAKVNFLYGLIRHELNENLEGYDALSVRRINSILKKRLEFNENLSDFEVTEYDLYYLENYCR